MTAVGGDYQKPLSHLLIVNASSPRARGAKNKAMLTAWTPLGRGAKTKQCLLLKHQLSGGETQSNA